MTRSEALEQAKRCICEDRDKQYGPPENSFKAVASLWNGFLLARGAIMPTGDKIRPEDVAVMMALFKIARISTGSFKADSFVDGIGYLACGAEIASPKTEPVPEPEPYTHDPFYDLM